MKLLFVEAEVVRQSVEGVPAAVELLPRYEIRVNELALRVQDLKEDYYDDQVEDEDDAS